MNYIPDVKAIKGTAPTALQMNALANNLEYLNQRKFPRSCLLRLNANTTLTMSGTTGFATLSYDTVVVDNSSMFSGGVITIPSDSQFIRVMAGLRLTAYVTGSIGIYPQNYSAELGGSDVNQMWLAFQITKDNGSTWQGAQVIHLDTGWQKVNSSITNYQNLIVGASGTVTAQSDVNTWISVEVI